MKNILVVSYHLTFDIVLGRRGEMGRCAVVDREGLLCGTEAFCYGQLVW